jgi:hypothetical protein
LIKLHCECTPLVGSLISTKSPSCKSK